MLEYAGTLLTIDNLKEGFTKKQTYGSRDFEIGRCGQHGFFILLGQTFYLT